jgi:hypothetical protein
MVEASKNLNNVGFDLTKGIEAPIEHCQTSTPSVCF